MLYVLNATYFVLNVAPRGGLVCSAQPGDAEGPVRLVVGDPQLHLLRRLLLLLRLLLRLLEDLLDLRGLRRPDDDLLAGLELPRGTRGGGAAGRGRQLHRGARGDGARPDADRNGLAGQPKDGPGLKGWTLNLHNLK